jgi:hypothetical protein
MTLAIYPFRKQVTFVKDNFNVILQLNLMVFYFTEFASNSFDKAEAAIFFYKPCFNSIKKSCEIIKRGGKIIILGEANYGDIMIPSDKCISYQKIAYNDILDPPGKFQEMWCSCMELMKTTDIIKQVLQIDQQETSVFDVLANRAVPLQRNSKVNEGEKLSFSSFSFSARGIAPDTKMQVLPVGMDQYELKHNRTYMVAGGVRGFGFEVARWMAHKGKILVN